MTVIYVLGWFDPLHLLSHHLMFAPDARKPTVEIKQRYLIAIDPLYGGHSSNNNAPLCCQQIRLHQQQLGR
jgi:hypothetical protein